MTDATKVWRFWCTVVGAVAAISVASAQERLILERKSAFNHIHVFDEPDGTRTMRFARDGARQSVVKLGDPDYLEFAYAKAMPIAFALVPKPERVLVIGLGGGSLPMFFRKRMPNLRIDAVEIDPEVVAIAKSHFEFREDERMRSFVADGRKYVEETKERYDIVVIDAYGNDAPPYALVTKEFHAAVRRALAPGGVAISNVWEPRSNRLYASILKTHENVYDATAILYLQRSTNRLVIGCAGAALPAKNELVVRARSLAQSLPLRDDLARMVADGLRPIGRDSDGGQVLIDAVPPR